MDQHTIKGIIKDPKFEEKYDSNGVKYKDYVFTIDSRQYTTQIKDDKHIYLQDGMNVVLQLQPGSSRETISGYCVKEGYTWGQSPNILKKQVSATEKYDFLEGRILEKRKSTTGFIYMNRSAISNRGSRIGYTIVLEDNKEFHASRDEGEYLQVGMNIATVLDQKASVIILNKETDTWLGLSRPYFIVFLLALIAFNGYAFFAKQTPFANFKVTLIVVNIFLVLAFFLSLATFRVTSQAKRFLLSKINQE